MAAELPLAGRGESAGRPVPAQRAAASADTDPLPRPPLVERDLRLGLEAAYRSLARLEREDLARSVLVDRAHAVRPRTLL